MKSSLLILPFALCTLLAHLPAGAQLRNNYYFAPDSKAQVNKLSSIAAIEKKPLFFSEQRLLWEDL